MFYELLIWGGFPIADTLFILPMVYPQGMRAGPKESENTLKKVSEVKKKYASLARFILQLEKPAAMTATYRAKLRSLPA